MDGEERLSVRLSSEDIILLNELVYRHRYGSLAEAVSDAVRSLIDREFTPEEKESLLSKAESRRDLDINDFTSDGADAEEVLKNVIVRGMESERKEDD